MHFKSQKIIKMSLTIVTAFGTVVAPRIANTIANAQKEEVNKYLEKSFKFLTTILPTQSNVRSAKFIPYNPKPN